MPPRVALDAYLGPGEAPPSYDVAMTPQEFEQKAARVAEESSRADYYDSGSGKAGKLKQTQYDEFEDWNDAKFEAAAAAYQARLARQRQAANAASGSSSSGSNYRAQSPRRDETRPSVMPDMPASSFHGAKPNYTHQNAGQLPAPSQLENHGQRMLPQRPTDVHNNQAGPSSPPRPRTSGSGGAPIRSATSPPPPMRRDSYSNAAMTGWGSPPNSQDGHGRASLESLPPFANMDPLMAQSPTEYEPPSGGSETSSMPHQTLQYQHQHQNYSAPPTARPNNFSAVPPPPPLSIPLHQQHQSASFTPQTSSSATSSSSLATPGPISHRHSEIPSTTSSPMVAPNTPQRHSDVPSIHTSSNQRPPPPTFSGPPNPMHAFDKKPFYPQGGNSASKALYASANMKSSVPSVRIDLNKLAYHGHTPPSAPEEPVSHQSLYSSSIQSHLPAKRTAPMPPPRRTNTTDTQFSPQQQPPYDQRYPAQNQPYGQPYGNPAPGFYGDSGNRPATQYPNQGVYQQPQQTQVYPTSFQSQLPLQQTQELPPQAYQPPPQNYWAPNPGMWQNYGH